MNKGDLMKLVLTKEELGYCDSAIPMELWPTCDTSLCVFNCRTHKIVNLAELLVSSGKLDELVNKISDLEYQIRRRDRMVMFKDLPIGTEFVIDDKRWRKTEDYQEGFSTRNVIHIGTGELGTVLSQTFLERR